MAKSKNPRLCQLVTPFESDNSLSWQSEYPRPQLKRDNWQSLCGSWQLSVKKSDGTTEALGGITVPYPPESRISGIMRPLADDEQYIYKKVFTIDDTYNGKKVLLHFGAVDTHCTVYINGRKAGSHSGGYLPFTFDITDLVTAGENTVSAEVTDTLDIDLAYGKQTKKRGGDVHIGLTISFMEAAHGCKKTVTINRQETCPDCHGTGAKNGTQPETCPDCRGTGQVMQQQRTPFGVIQNARPCTKCGGKGKIIKEPCQKCRGNGRVSVQVKKEVNIPAGIDDEQSLALRGEGDMGTNGGAQGDVIIVVSVKPDAVFKREKYNVFVEVPITYSQAVLGDEIIVPTIDGKVQYKVPEGTQSGTVFRLRQKGIKYLNGIGRGDQYVTVNVEIPKKVTREQRKALEAFEATLKDDNYEQRKGFFKKIKDMFD